MDFALSKFLLIIREQSDINNGSKVTTHLEHGKSVYPTEPLMCASGSDDGTGMSTSLVIHTLPIRMHAVKLWVTNRQHSIHTLDTKANVY